MFHISRSRPDSGVYGGGPSEGNGVVVLDHDGRWLMGYRVSDGWVYLYGGEYVSRFKADGDGKGVTISNGWKRKILAIAVE